MKSAYPTTILMGLFALVAAGIAAANYPWPEAVSENAQVNKPLFADYETTAVRGITITAYNESRSGIERFRLKRNGERWVIPEKSDFDVTGADSVNRVARSLNDCTVLEVSSDSQEDHVNYGVVDPNEVGSGVARSSLGVKLELVDRDRKSIGSIIVGNQVKDSRRKYYVRVPGRPTVYAIEFDKNILNTEFGAWVDPNLMKLPTDPNSGLTLTEIAIERHRIDAATNKKESLYRCIFAADKARRALVLNELTIGGKQSDAAELPPGFMQTVFTGISGLRLTDVIKQKKNVVSMLEKSADGSETAAAKSLADAGFLYRGWLNSGHQIEGINGGVILNRSDGVRYRLAVGKLANRVGGESLSLLYRVMVTADADESSFSVPEETEFENEEQEKTYLRKLNDRDEKLQIARQQVAEVNRQHRRWVYVIDEQVINRVLPTLNTVPQK